MKHVRDTWLIFQYEVALLVRNPATVAITLIQPITYLLLFSPFLKSVMHVSTYSNAFQIYVPSLFAAIGVFNGLFVGFTLLAAVRQGVVTRHRVTPVSRVSLLLGRLLMHILLIVFQAVVVTVAAIALGLRVQPANFLISLAACGPSSRPYRHQRRLAGKPHHGRGGLGGPGVVVTALQPRDRMTAFWSFTN